MVKLYIPRFQQIPLGLAWYLLILLFLFCPDSWASQDALVISQRAIVYSDKKMTSPVGYIRRGKKIKVGEIARNNAQVYPIIVSGKIAYIRVSDVTTERESMGTTRLVSERFFRSTTPDFKYKFVASYYAFNSVVGLNEQNAELQDQDALAWNGLSLKGEVLLKKRYDFQILTNFMNASQGEETFRAIEFGLGGAYRLIDKEKFITRVEAQLLAVPFSTYEVGEDFRIRSYGYTVGAGLNMTYLFTKNWGIEGSAGLYRTSLLNFQVPAPYKEVSPVFSGSRIGIGLNYSYQ